MKLGRVTVLIAPVVGAMLLASTAAAGESKNQAPFTKTITATGTVAGESKKELPFTRVVIHVAAPPDLFERYAASHPYGSGLATAVVPDSLERYAAAHPYGSGLATVVPTSSGFRWRDAAIGSAATAAALALLLSVILLSLRHRGQIARPLRT